MEKTRTNVTDVKSSACPVFKATLQADRKHVILVPWYCMTLVQIDVYPGYSEISVCVLCV